MTSAHPNPHRVFPQQTRVASRLNKHEDRLKKIEAILPTLATKADMNALRLEMLACFERYYAEMHKLDARTTRRMIATVISLFLGFAGLFIAMRSNTVASTALPTPPAIIYLPSAAQSAVLTPPS